MEGLLDSAETAKRLGIKLSTLYVYVSRGLIVPIRADDGRRSLFSFEEIERFSRSRGDRRSAGPRDVVVTSITRISARGPIYRGYDATSLLGRPFESVADLLFGQGPGEWLPYDLSLPEGLPLHQRLRLVVVLSGVTEGAARESVDVIREARALIATCAAHLADPPITDAGTLPLSRRIAMALNSSEDRDALAAVIDAFLVLLADHELSRGTRAVRLAASARASFHDAVLAGICVLGGSLQRGNTELLVNFFRRCSVIGPARAIDELESRDLDVPGFSKSVYEDGDPRFRALRHFVQDVMTDAQRDLLDELLDEAARRQMPAPSIQLALGSLIWAIRAPSEISNALFIISRMAGWTAHYLEELTAEPVRLTGQAIYAMPAQTT